MLTEIITELIPAKPKSSSVFKNNSERLEICICNQKPEPVRKISKIKKQKKIKKKNPTNEKKKKKTKMSKKNQNTQKKDRKKHKKELKKQISSCLLLSFSVFSLSLSSCDTVCDVVCGSACGVCGECVRCGVCGVSIQNVPACTFETSPCTPATRAHVETHVRVVPVDTKTFLNVHTETF